ncbi:MAG: transketolase C-terminal domain-containing protein [Candidatus Sericytochromatia bacterium]
MKIKDAVRLALLAAHNQGLIPAGVWGQDNKGTGPGAKGGVLAETQGLPFAHNTILNERSAAWLPYGAAVLGQPGVGIMQFADYQHNTYDIMKIIGETCWSSGGRVPMPLVILTAYGALQGKGAMYHSQTVENEMVGLPGWKVVSAATPNDAASLLLAAIKDPNPVHFMYPRAHSGLPTDSATIRGLAHLELPGFALLPGEKELMESPGTGGKSRWLNLTSAPADQRDGSWVQHWPEGLLIPEDSLGKAKVVRQGDYGVVFSHGRMLPMAWKAAESLSFLTNRQIAVVDLRTLKPAPIADMEPFIRQSQGRILFLNEATAANNWMKTLAQDLIQRFGWGFETYPEILTATDSPVGQALEIEIQVVPQPEDVFASLCAFFGPEQLEAAARAAGAALERNSEGWFDRDRLKAFAPAAFAHAESGSPAFSTPVNPLKTLSRSKA